MATLARCTGFSQKGWKYELIPCLSGGYVPGQLIKVGDHFCKRSIIFLSQNLLQQLTPTGSNVSLHQLCSSFLDEGINQWGDLQGEIHPTRVPHPPIGGLTHMLQCMDIGQKPGCAVPLLWVFTQKLPNVQHGGSRWAQGHSGHPGCPPPCSHKVLSELLGGCVTPISQWQEKQPPCDVLLTQIPFTGLHPLSCLPHGVQKCLYWRASHHNASAGLVE